MATTTANYNFTKIELTDSPPDITVLNGNFDTIDSALHGVSSQLGGLAFYVDPSGILHIIYDDGE